MANITQVRVAVRRLIAMAKYENVTYEFEATATVDGNQSPADVTADTLAFCQHMIIKEMDRMEKGLPPRPMNPLDDDTIPDFKPASN